MSANNEEPSASIVFYIILVLVIVIPIVLVTQKRRKRIKSLLKMDFAFTYNENELRLQSATDSLPYKLVCNTDVGEIYVMDLVCVLRHGTYANGSENSADDLYKVHLVDDAGGYGAQTHFVVNLNHPIPRFYIKPIDRYERRFSNRKVENHELLDPKFFIECILDSEDNERVVKVLTKDFQKFWANQEELTMICDGRRLDVFRYDVRLSPEEIMALIQRVIKALDFMNLKG